MRRISGTELLSFLGPSFEASFDFRFVGGPLPGTVSRRALLVPVKLTFILFLRVTASPDYQIRQTPCIPKSKLPVPVMLTFVPFPNNVIPQLRWILKHSLIFPWMLTRIMLRLADVFLDRQFAQTQCIHSPIGAFPSSQRLQTRGF
jgi:hypothetical protein